MGIAADPERTEIELVGVLFGIDDEFTQGVGRYRSVEDHHLLGEDHVGERFEILLRIVRQVGEQKWIERNRARGQKAEGMAVRLGVLARGGPDRRVSAGLVVDDESLTGSFLESLTQCTGKHIDRPSRREGNDQSYRLPRKILGAGSGPCEQKRTSRGEQPRAGFGQHRLLPRFGWPFLRGLPSVGSYGSRDPT